MLKKLRLKFVCIVMAIVTVMLCTVMGFIIGFTDLDMKRQREDVLQSAATDPAFLPELREKTSALPYFLIQNDGRGNLLVRWNGGQDRYDEEQLRWLWEETAGTESGIIESYLLEYRRVSTPKGERCVFVDISAQEKMMGGLYRICSLVTVAALAVFLGISVVLARWAVKPVEQAWQQQKQFVADASHELKTPLTVILTNAELLRESDADASERMLQVERILTMSEQMRVLVEGLLELARMDNGNIGISREILDLSSLTEEMVMTFEPLFFERNLELAGDVRGDICIRGSESQFRQVLDILLDNAVKYSREGSTVTVRLEAYTNVCFLSVSSPGPLLTPQQQNLIFKRFYRVDPNRSRDGSYGLGLPIAKSIVEAHGGKIWAQSAEECNVFCVQMPLNK